MKSILGGKLKFAKNLHINALTNDYNNTNQRAIFLTEKDDIEIEPFHLEGGEVNAIFTFKGSGLSFLILTNLERKKVLKNTIKNELWTLKPQFLINYMELDGNENIILSLKTMQERIYESANDLFFALVKRQFESLCHDLIQQDYAGTFLSPYDGEEIKSEKNILYAYRLN